MATATSIGENSVWQKLMDGAYARWQGKKWSYKEFLDQCSPIERKAVLLGNLNYQIGNGGFRQWVDNGYALHGREVISVLEDIGTRPAIDLSARIEELLQHVNMDKPNRGFDDYWERNKCPHCDREDEEPEGLSVADEMDDWYYAEIEPVLLSQIEGYLIILLSEEQ